MIVQISYCSYKPYSEKRRHTSCAFCSSMVKISRKYIKVGASDRQWLQMRLKIGEQVWASWIDKNAHTNHDLVNRTNATLLRHLMQFLRMGRSSWSLCTSVEKNRALTRSGTTAMLLLRDNYNLAALPSTKPAAKQHFLRVFLQIQQWAGSSLDSPKWGWVTNKNGLVSITTDQEPASQSLLSTLSSNCTKGCTTTWLAGKRELSVPQFTPA